MSMSFKQLETETVSTFDEQKWVITIQQVLQEEHEADEFEHTSISIFEVPKSLTSVKPEAYTPQHVSIGPYHLFRTELYEMRRYKLYAARRTRNLLNDNQQISFQDIVDHFAKHELKVRAPYNRFLDFNGETIAWMMALDASFLLEFLQIVARKRGKVLLTRVPSKVNFHFYNSSGNISAHNAIHRDIMMLENQIPLFVLMDFFGFLMPKSDELFQLLLKVFYTEVSPFKNLNHFPSLEELSQRNHLLELLYYMIVPEKENPSEIQQNKSTKEPPICLSYPMKLFHSISCSSLVKTLKRVLTWEKIKTMAKSTWVFTNKVVPTSKKESLEKIISSVEKVVEIEEEGPSESPLAEELQIPSVSDLSSVGIKFHATNGGLYSIRFDQSSLTFYLPTITVDENSDVILRNLVAFEACAIAGALIFTRYTELMNGIIDSEEDVKVLRKQGIIVNHLRSDGEVADLWNGMSRSVKLTKVDFLDKAIEDVNRFYNGKWKVKVGRLMKDYVYACWPFLTLLAATLILVSTILQSVCSVYNCNGVVKYISNN